MKGYLLLALLALTGCVGAFQGADFRPTVPHYWGAIDVLAVSADGSPRPGVTVRATFGIAESGKVRDSVEAVTDANGHAKLTIIWIAKHSAHDATGDYIRADVDGHEVIVRPAVVSSLTLTLPKGQVP